MSNSEKVYEIISKYRDEVIEIQKALTRCVALGPENGGSGEHEKAEVMKELLRELKPDHMEMVKAPDVRARDGYRPNLIAQWHTGKGCGWLWVLCHTDIVPPGDLSLWDQDPYEIKVDGDKIFGRGVEDNHHGFVSPYLALKAVIECGAKLKRNVGIVAVADEETGSRYGLQYLLKHKQSLFKKDDLIIVPDGGSDDGTMVEVAEKSMLWLRFVVKGEQCHASTPHKGKNSLFGAAKLILALEKLKLKFSEEDELFSPPISTFEPTKIEANVPNINTIPGKDVFYMDCRILPHYSVEQVLDVCGKIARDMGEELGMQIDVEVAHREDAAPPTSPEAPVVKALGAAIRKIMGKEAKPTGIGGGTVAAFFRKAGLPAAVWITCPDTAHQPNEYCKISDILSDASVFACLFMGHDTH